MGYKVEFECDQTFVDPTTGEIGVHAGERRPEGHPDVQPSWRPVLVEVDDPPPTPIVAPPSPAPAPAPAVKSAKTAT